MSGKKNTKFGRGARVPEVQFEVLGLEPETVEKRLHSNTPCETQCVQDLHLQERRSE